MSSQVTSRRKIVLMSMTLEEVRQAVLLTPPGLNRHFDADPVDVVVLDESARMDVVPRDDHQTLRESVDAWARAMQLTGIRVLAVVNGSYGGRSAAARPSPVSEYGLSGYVVRNGRYDRQGTSDSANAFLARTDSGYVFGRGNTPESCKGQRVLAGLSALPIVLEKFNAAPGGFYARLGGDSTEGRVIVGHDPLRRRIILIVQGESFGRIGNHSLDTLRALARSVGCRDAVGLDGSTSAMLRCDLGCHHGWVVTNSFYKNNICANAVAFFRLPGA